MIGAALESLEQAGQGWEALEVQIPCGHAGRFDKQSLYPVMVREPALEVAFHPTGVHPARSPVLEGAALGLGCLAGFAAFGADEGISTAVEFCRRALLLAAPEFEWVGSCCGCRSRSGVACGWRCCRWAWKGDTLGFAGCMGDVNVFSLSTSSISQAAASLGCALRNPCCGTSNLGASVGAVLLLDGAALVPWSLSMVLLIASTCRGL